MIRQPTEFTARERDILSLLAQGHNAIEIAADLNITTNYIYTIIRLLKARFNVKTCAGIISRAISEGIIDGEGVFLQGRQEQPSH